MKDIGKAISMELILIGAGFAYYFPDLDIRLLGIGKHRYFFFHSAIAPIIVFLLLDRKNGLLFSKAMNIIVASFAVRIGIHLFIDVFQSKSVVFPFAKTLMYGTSIDDRIWEGANSIISLLIGKKSFKNIQEIIEG